MTGAPSTVVQQIEAPNERVDGFVDAVQRRRKRGHEVEAISDGSNEEASLERFAVDRETIARKVGARPSGAWVHEVARGDRTEAAGAPDRGVVREARPGRAEPLREHASAFEYWRLVEEREARRRHRAGNRVCRVTVAVQKCARLLRLAPKEIEQRVGRAGHCERKDAARQPFRKAKDVRSDARFNAREEGSGSTEACHDLVEDVNGCQTWATSMATRSVQEVGSGDVMTPMMPDRTAEQQGDDEPERWEPRSPLRPRTTRGSSTRSRADDRGMLA